MLDNDLKLDFLPPQNLKKLKKKSDYHTKLSFKYNHLSGILLSSLSITQGDLTTKFEEIRALLDGENY